MLPPVGRRSFMTTPIAALCGATMGAAQVKPAGKGRPIAVSSANGLETVKLAIDLVKKGYDPLDAAIAGVALVEADPTDHTVGYGGIPNEDGIVELDASVMHGPTHGGGAVASLRNIKHPAAVARLVMKRTDHCLIVGEGALRFARAHGFPEENLLTEEARKIWLYWKETSSRNDDRVPPPPEEVDPEVKKFFGPDYVREYGTIHCSVLDTHGDLGCTTTTSGLYYKIPGRVGDSPILGAGLYLNNDVGSAGSTGRGEANLLNLSSFLAVEEMRRSPDKPLKDVLIECCRRIVATNRDKRLQDAKGRPNFNVNFYAIRKNGEFAGAALFAGPKMAVHDGDSARLVECVPLYDEVLKEI